MIIFSSCPVKDTCTSSSQVNRVLFVYFMKWQSIDMHFSLTLDLSSTINLQSHEKNDRLCFHVIKKRFTKTLHDKIRLISCQETLTPIMISPYKTLVCSAKILISKGSYTLLCIHLNKPSSGGQKFWNPSPWRISLKFKYPPVSSNLIIQCIFEVLQINNSKSRICIEASETASLIERMTESQGHLRISSVTLNKLHHRRIIPPKRQHKPWWWICVSIKDAGYACM